MVPAYFNRADVYRRLGRLAEALADYDKMIELYPDHPAAHSNRGAILKAMVDSTTPALASSARLSSIRTSPKAWSTAPMSRSNRADSTTPRPTMAARSRRSRSFPEASHGLALALLSEGDWDTGFALSRRASGCGSLPSGRCPSHVGPRMPALGERLLLLCEQGLGDTIQFSRFAPVFAERGDEVTLLAPPSMQRVLSRSKGMTVANISDAPAVNGRPTHGCR